MNELIEELLKLNEKVWLEYKSFWYWNEGDSEQKGWGEFLKDFVALFNTYTKQKDEKYFIIGFDETTKNVQNFDIDQNGNKINIFCNINLFKSKIIDKLKNHFKNLPDYRNSINLIQIENLFEVEIVQMDDNIKILLIRIKSAPYLLELKKQLTGNETFRSGNIITRIEKDDNSPENTNANSNQIDELKKTVSEIQIKDFPEKEISIKKIVDVFKERNFPSAKVEHKLNENNLSSGIYFEIYSIRGDEYVPKIDFIYFSKHTIQKRALEYIEQKKLLDKDGIKIILVDEINKDKGKTDKERIQKIFKETFQSVEVYYLEEFAIEKLSKNLFNVDIFHEGNFDIQDFIKPFTDISDDKTADLLLKEWYYSPNEPLLVMKGIGGIGKTTVIKYFLDDLYRANNKNNLNILFINSHEIINDIMRNPTINDIFDFYKTLADKEQISDRFDKKLLELLIDSGNMIIVLDGLDEVIAKMGNKFKIKEFIEAIFKNYSETLAKTKIIITCRDYFWDMQEFNSIKTMSLEPFTKDMAKKYFEKSFSKFDSAVNKVDKAVAQAENFASQEHNNKNIFIPYILDMIKEDLLLESSSKGFSTNILLTNTITNDFIIAKSCEREIEKLDNLSIDRQIEIFIYIATKYNGAILKEHFCDIQNEFQIKSSEFIGKFKAHPLLEYKNEKLIFRYDFFNEYFKNIKVAIFFQENDFSRINKELVEIINQHVSYDGSLAKNLVERLNKKIDFEDLKFSILQFIEEQLFNVKDFNDEIKKRLNSSLFILLLKLKDNNNTEQRTELLKEIYQRDKNLIKNFCIINLHTTSLNKPLFDFKDLKFENCHFENYDFFTECKFSEKTFFTNTAFISPLHRDGISTELTWGNIEKSSCNTEGIMEVLDNQKEKSEKKCDSLRKDLKQIFKFFWSSSAFKQKTKEEMYKKLRSNSQLLEILIDKSIILKEQVTTKQKRNDVAYSINSKYSNLRKIMEENDTCFEFEDIVQMVQNK